MVIFITGCCKNSNSQLVLPPCRVGEGSVQVSLDAEYPFTSAFAAADAVARVEIGNWIGEDMQIHKTYYEATVLEFYKGNIPAAFTLLQDGCSAGTLKGYPLFTCGNELLVFLKEATGLDYNAPYWIIGSFTTVLDVSYDASGNRYFADRYGILGETMSIPANYALEADTFHDVYARITESDSVVQDMNFAYPFVFSEIDVMCLLT